MAEETWESVLVDLESRIDLAMQCLDEGRDIDAGLLTAWTPPKSLGPLPAHLRNRAIAINQRQTAVSVRIQTEMSSISDELQRAPTTASRKASLFGEKEIPAFFDSAV